jgi:hypothetical protein
VLSISGDARYSFFEFLLYFEFSLLHFEFSNFRISIFRFSIFRFFIFRFQSSLFGFSRLGFHFFFLISFNRYKWTHGIEKRLVDEWEGMFTWHKFISFFLQFSLFYFYYLFFNTVCFKRQIDSPWETRFHHLAAIASRATNLIFHFLKIIIY